MSTEADTCGKYVLPKLLDAGWDHEPHSFTERRTFTDGRIVVAGKKIYRRPQKRADYLLRYTRDYPSPSSKPRRPTNPSAPACSKPKTMPTSSA